MNPQWNKVSIFIRKWFFIISVITDNHSSNFSQRLGNISISSLLQMKYLSYQYGLNTSPQRWYQKPQRKVVNIDRKKQEEEELRNRIYFSRSVVSDSLQPHRLQHARPPCDHQIPESTQTHVHLVSEAIQPSRPLSIILGKLLAWASLKTNICENYVICKVLRKYC